MSFVPDRTESSPYGSVSCATGAEAESEAGVVATTGSLGFGEPIDTADRVSVPLDGAMFLGVIAIPVTS